jgi:hypothetical protein
MVTIDLYELYTKRFADYDILSNFPEQPVPGTFTKKQIFYGLFRILLGCDAAHDFMASRGGELLETERKLFIKGMSTAVTFDLTSVAPGLDTACESLINYTKYKISGNNTYFNSDNIAKETAERILNYLGLKLTGLNEIGYGDCTGDYGIARMVKIINFANRGTTDTPGLNFTLRVDATQNTLDMIPIYSSLLMEARLRASNCSNTYNIKLEEDISSVYDAANDDKLQKSLRENDFVSSSIVNTTFDIRCGRYNVVQCTLSLLPGSQSIVTLNVTKYFTQDISITVNNEKIGGSANNSVKGLVKKMKEESSRVVDDNIKREIIYQYSIGKTMGDFFTNSQLFKYIFIRQNVCICRHFKH